MSFVCFIQLYEESQVDNERLREKLKKTEDDLKESKAQTEKNVSVSIEISLFDIHCYKVYVYTNKNNTIISVQINRSNVYNTYNICSQIGKCKLYV